MPKKYDKAVQFSLTPLDKEVLALTEYDIDLWSKGYFGGQMFPYQKYFYHAPQKNKLLAASIRIGKSYLASAGALHNAQFHPYTRFLNTSISSEQAKIVYQNCLQLCSMPNFQHWVEHSQSSPYPLIRLVNGSELWFRPLGYQAEHIRGYEFDFINVDEAAYITQKQTIDILRGRLIGINHYTGLPRQGIIWLISSPKGQGWLYERWKQGDPQFRVCDPLKFLSLRATIKDNPLLDQDQINDIMADYTDAMIRQEFFGEFISVTDAVFPYDLVMDGCDDQHREVKWIYDQIAFWNAQQESLHPSEYKSLRAGLALTEDIMHYECEVQAGHRYINSWDLGKKPTSKGRNAMVGIVLDITHEPWSMVAYRYAEGMGYVEGKAEIERWHQKYSGNGSLCSTIIDATGKGDVLQEFMEVDREVRDLTGMVYTGQNKPMLVDSGKFVIERGLARYPFIRRMVDQLSQYDRFDKELPQDIVMAFCQACWKAREYSRITTASQGYSLQRALNSMQQQAQSGMRSKYATRSPRYVEGRMARRGLRQAKSGTRRRSA